MSTKDWTNVRLALGSEKQVVEVDGVNIAHTVGSVELRADGNPANRRLVLDLLVHEVVVDGEMKVVVPTATHEALAGLGWTPPGSDELAEVLRLIEAHDTDYEIRYPLVWRALSLALAAGYVAGVRIDPAEPDWPVVYIELPQGQTSWHMPQYPVEFDGHSTAEKYERVRAFTDPTTSRDA